MLTNTALTEKPESLHNDLVPKTETCVEIESLREEIRLLKTEIHRLENEEVRADDPRVRHIWINAAKEAEKGEYCGEYDRVAEELGGWARDDLRAAGDLDETYMVLTQITIELSLPVEACSAQDAVEKIDEMSSTALRELACELGFGLGNLDIENWDAREAVWAD